MIYKLLSHKHVLQHAKSLFITQVTISIAQVKNCKEKAFHPNVFIMRFSAFSYGIVEFILFCP